METENSIAADLPVIDLHCDLVTYLHVDSGRTPFEPGPRCSLSQLRAGGVELQTLALFTLTKSGSSESGLEQARIFADLLVRYGAELASWSALEEDAAGPDGRIGVVAAVESASGFSEEDEPLDDAFARFDRLQEIAGPILYVSPTWFPENRFAGGNGSPDVGLKDDGEVLLEYLAEKHVALDFSHLSPRAGHEAMDFLGKRGLTPPVMASHSGFAALQDTPRNLPDDVAREIFRRGGVVGLNFMRPFLGDAPTSPAAHLAHGLELGGRDHMALGADYFCVEDMPADVLRKRDPSEFFYEEFGDSSCYPRFLQMIADEGVGPDGWLPELAHGNARRFLESVLSHQVAAVDSLG